MYLEASIRTDGFCGDQETYHGDKMSHKWDSIHEKTLLTFEHKWGHSSLLKKIQHQPRKDLQKQTSWGWWKQVESFRQGILLLDRMIQVNASQIEKGSSFGNQASSFAAINSNPLSCATPCTILIQQIILFIEHFSTIFSLFNFFFVCMLKIFLFSYSVRLFFLIII